jgi:Ni/Co efflux regulator RcnB
MKITLIALTLAASGIAPAMAQPATSCDSSNPPPGVSRDTSVPSCLHVGPRVPNQPVPPTARPGDDRRYSGSDDRRYPGGDNRRYSGGDDRRYSGGYDARDADRWRGNGQYYYGARGPEWRRGAHIPREYMGRQYWVQDWRAHRLSAPPRGYQWVQVGGDYVLVALATGIIAQLLLSQQ